MIKAIALINISDSYFLNKNYTRALDVGQEALAMEFLKKATKRRASILLIVGLIYFELNELNKAIPLLMEAQQIATNKGILKTQMQIHQCLAKIYEKKENLIASNYEQKMYIKTRNIYLKEIEEAGKLALKRDINTRDEEIAESNSVIAKMENKTRNLIVSSSLALLLLGGTLFFYVKRKKTIEKEKIKLREQYLHLKNTILVEKATSRNTSKPQSYKNSSLTTNDYEYHKKNILSYMDKEKPYLDAALKQSDLAKKLNITSHHFSEILNFCFNQNFYNFINSYRIIEAQNLIKKPSYIDAKIIAIAFDAGFKSKTSFNRVFKKHTGLTPSEYKETI